MSSNPDPFNWRKQAKLICIIMCSVYWLIGMFLACIGEQASASFMVLVILSHIINYRIAIKP